MSWSKSSLKLGSAKAEELLGFLFSSASSSKSKFSMSPIDSDSLPKFIEECPGPESRTFTRPGDS